MLARSAACAKCVFSRKSDTYWRAVVFDDSTNVGMLNQGACFARAAGGSESCGRAEARWGACYAYVCPGATCGSDAAVSACMETEAAERACAPLDTTAKDCGGATRYAALDKACKSFIDVARVLCGS